MRIYNKELKSYFLEGMDCFERYASMKQGVLNPDSHYYGAKLCSTKRVKVAYTIKFSFYFRNQFYWKPVYSLKYSQYFHWLFFMIWLESEYDEVIDEVLVDYLEIKK